MDCLIWRFGMGKVTREGIMNRKRGQKHEEPLNDL